MLSNKKLYLYISVMSFVYIVLSNLRNTHYDNRSAYFLQNTIAIEMIEILENLVFNLERHPRACRK
jgi:hypothetical protein